MIEYCFFWLLRWPGDGEIEDAEAEAKRQEDSPQVSAVERDEETQQG